MLTYNSIASKDDKKYLTVAKRVLGQSFMEVSKDAEIAFHEAADAEPNELKKPNAARRAANLVYLAAMKECGVTNWREWQDNHKTTQDYKAMSRPEYNAPATPARKKHWTGKSIVEVGDQKRKEIHEKMKLKR